MSLKIHNPLGQEVKTWFYKNKQAGYYTLTWDSVDRYGHLLPSGIYIVHMAAADFTKIRKITFIR